MKHLYFNPHEGVVSVKQGFSWPACIFGSLWAMAHHMWAPYVLVLLPVEVIFGLLTGLVQASHDEAMAIGMLLANLGLAAVRGWYGNRWLADSLRRRGYVENNALPIQA